MICKIMNIYNGDNGTKILSLPKNEEQLNSALVDLGVDRRNGFVHEVIFVKTRSKEIDKAILSLKLRVEEVNLFAMYYEETTPEWDVKFERMLKVFKPDNAKDFLNLMYESEAYSFYKAKTLEEIGEKLISQYPAMGRWTAKDVGEMFHEQNKGSFVLNSLYMVKDESLLDENTFHYNGVSVGDFYLASEDKDYVCSVAMFNKEKYEAYMLEGAEKPPYISLMLPTTINELCRAMDRLGGNEITYFVSPLTEHFPTNLAAKFSIGYINEFAELWSELEKDNDIIEKLSAVLAYEGREETIEDLLDCYSRLDEYKIYPGVCDYGILLNLDRKDNEKMTIKEKNKKINQYMCEYNGCLSGDYGLVLKTNGKKGIEEFLKVECI